MARQGHRKRIAPNIFRDDTRYAVIVKVGGKPKEHRFLLSTPLAKLEEARDRLKGQARDEERPRAGSLADDAAQYLLTIEDKKKRKHRAILCRHWTRVHGRDSRFALTKLMIEQQLVSWMDAGVSPSTCNKRLSVLRGIFNTVNTDDDPNPAAKVKKRKEPEPEPRGLAYSLIERILGEMPDRGKPTGGGQGSRPTVSLAKLRCAWMAYTGLPPAQSMKINPDVDLQRVVTPDPETGADVETHVLRGRPRRKGKGTRETWLPLAPQAVEVLALLVTHGGLTTKGTLKPFSTSSVRQSWMRGCVKVIAAQLGAGETPLPHKFVTKGTKATLVPLVRPYDLRHSFLTQALRSSGNLRGVQELGQHADARQTQRYIQNAVPQAARDAAVAMHASLPAIALPKHLSAKERILLSEATKAKAAGTRPVT